MIRTPEIQRMEARIETDARIDAAHTRACDLAPKIIGDLAVASIRYGTIDRAGRLESARNAAQQIVRDIVAAQTALNGGG